MVNRSFATSHAAALSGRSSDSRACVSSVDGQLPGRASIAPGFLPPGFRLTSGDPSNITAGWATYSASSPRKDPPRVTINYDVLVTPLNGSVGGRAVARWLVIQDHPAILEDGAPGTPIWISVYWKPDKMHLISVVGYKLKEATVIRVARKLALTPAGPVALPLTPGSIVSRSAALAAAQGALPKGTVTATKLTSWTEASTMLQWSDPGSKLPQPSRTLAVAPWQPIWAVLATSPSSSPELLLIQGSMGRLLMKIAVKYGTSWFGPLTDRDPSLAGCPGGSNVRVPFGVLTRNEETYTLRFEIATPRTKVVEKLTTNRTLNRVDPGLLGGCVNESCGLVKELVWPDMSETWAAPGKTLPCPPPWVSTPGGSNPRRVKEEYGISITDNSEGGCTALPVWVNRLKDLAPTAASR